MADYLSTGILVDYAATPTPAGVKTLVLPLALDPVTTRVVKVILENQDAANGAILTVAPTEGGLENKDETLSATVGPLSEGSVIFSEPLPPRLNVYTTAAAGAPPVRIRVRGVRRTV